MAFNYEYELKIDKQRFIRDLIKELEKQMNILGQEVVQLMRMNIALIPERGTTLAVGHPTWRRDVSNALKTVTKMKTAEIIQEFGIIDGTELQHFRAFLIEYGMGYEMDFSNPFLSAYMNTSNFNTNRPPNMTVLTRPGRSYFDPWTGGMTQSNAKTERPVYYFRQRPSHFMLNAIRMVEPNINKVIERTWNNMDLSKYLISTEKGR